MMKSKGLVVGWLLFALTGVLFAASPEEQEITAERIEDPLNPGIWQWDVVWPTELDHYYFFRLSGDMIHWNYLPEIRQGSDGSDPDSLSDDMSYTFLEGGTDRQFFKVKGTDQFATDVNQADFDFDGITNWGELSYWQTDPLSWDTDQDGLDDLWEIEYGIDPRESGIVNFVSDPSNPNGAAGDADGDGRSNMDEYLEPDATTDPTSNYHGLVASWSFDEGIGLTAKDAGPDGYHSTLNTSKATSSSAWDWNPIGVRGGSLEFHGNSPYVEAPAAALDGATDLTFSAWIKTTKTGMQGVLSAATSTYQNNLAIFLKPAAVNIYEKNGGAVAFSSSITLTDGEWHQVVVTRHQESGDRQLYVDGVLQTKKTTAGLSAVGVGTDGLKIGADQDALNASIADHFIGSMDEVRLYNRVLGPSEVLGLYHSTIDSDVDGLPDWWERTYFGSLVYDGEDDPDGDDDPNGVRQRNQEEYVNLTDPNEDIPSDLIAHYPLDDGQGSTAADASENGRAGSLRAMNVTEAWQIVPDAGVGRASLDLEESNNSNSRIELPNTVLDQLGEATFAFWVSLENSSSWGTLLNASNANVKTFEIQVKPSNGQLRIKDGTASAFTISTGASNTLASGAWHFIVVTRTNAGAYQAYLYQNETTHWSNGVTGKTSTAISVGDASEPTRSGVFLGLSREGMDDTSFSHGLQGSLDEVRFYNRALTSTQIDELYTHLLDSDDDNLPDQWELEHFGNLGQNGDGDPNNDGITNAQHYNGGINSTDPSNETYDARSYGLLAKSSHPTRMGPREPEEEEHDADPLPPNSGGTEELPEEPCGSHATTSRSESSGPKYRKIGLNGYPISDDKPQQEAETDRESTESYVDALTLALRHDITDVAVPLVGGELQLAVRRTSVAETWSTKPGLLPHERFDRPFGMGWESGLSAHLSMPEDPPNLPDNPDCYAQSPDPRYTNVTDENGTSHRFLMVYPPGTTQATFVPLPSNRTEQSSFTSSLTYSGSDLIFKRQFGTTLTFSGTADVTRTHTFAYTYTSANLYNKVRTLKAHRLTKVEDRFRNRLLYYYSPSNTSIAPDRIVAVADKSIADATALAQTVSSGAYRVITIHRSSHTLAGETVSRIDAITDPRGNTYRYDYDQHTAGSGVNGGFGKRYIPARVNVTPDPNHNYPLIDDPTGFFVLRKVTRPDGSSIKYAYQFDQEADWVPQGSGGPSPSFKDTHYFLNLQELRNGRGAPYQFNYQRDVSKSNMQADSSGNGKYYVSPGQPRIIESVILPNGATSQFSTELEHSPIFIDYQLSSEHGLNASNHTLQVLTSATNVSQLPSTGTSLTVVANISGTFYIRIFDGEGAHVVTASDNDVPIEKKQPFEEFKAAYPSFTGSTDEQVVQQAMGFAMHRLAGLQLASTEQSLDSNGEPAVDGSGKPIRIGREGVRKVAVRDADHQTRVYTFSDAQVVNMTDFQELLVPDGDPYSRKIDHLILWKKLTVNHPTGGSEAFHFNPEAGMALWKAEAYSESGFAERTRYYHHGDAWQIPSPLDFIDTHFTAIEAGANALYNITNFKSPARAVFPDYYPEPTVEINERYGGSHDTPSDLATALPSIAQSYRKNFRFKSISPTTGVAHSGAPNARIMDQIINERGKETLFIIDSQTGATKEEIIRNGVGSGATQVQRTVHDYTDSKFVGFKTASTVKGGATGGTTYPDLKTTFTPDAFGQVVTQTADPNNEALETAYTYDENANRTSITDPKGNVSFARYDPYNRLIEEIFPPTLDTRSGMRAARKRYQYDGSGYKVEEIDENGVSTFFVYDDLGRVIHRIWDMDHDGDYDLAHRENATAADLFTSFSYNNVGSVLVERDPNGNRKRTFYDGLQRVVSEVDEEGEVTQFFYRYADLDFNAPQSGSIHESVMLYINDDGGNTTIPVSTTPYETGGGAGLFSSSGFEPVAMRDPRGYLSVYAFDAQHRKLAELVQFDNSDHCDAKNYQITTYAYDSASNVTQVTKRVFETYTLDLAVVANTTQLPSSGRSLAVVALVGSDLHIRIFSSEGEQVLDKGGTQLGLGTTVTTLKNQLNSNPNEATLTQAQKTLLLSQAMEVSEATPFLTEMVDPDHDALNRVTHVGYYEKHSSLNNSPGHYASEWTHYTPTGLVWKREDKEERETEYSFDTVGRQTHVYRPDPEDGDKTADSPTIITAYDDNGNVEKITDPRTHETTYTFDTRNRMLTETTEPITYVNGEVGGSPSQAPAIITYGYDAVGNRTKVTDAKGNSSVTTFDNANRITAAHFPGVEVFGEGEQCPVRHQSFDKNGNMVAVEDENGNVTLNKYNGRDELIATKTNDTQVLDPEMHGQADNVTHVDDIVVRKGLDASGNLTELTVVENSTNLIKSRTQYIYDGLDRVTSVKRFDGSTLKDTETHTYNGFYSLTHTDCRGRLTKYEYDHLGRTSAVLYDTGTIGTLSIGENSYNNRTRNYASEIANLSHRMFYDRVGNLLEVRRASVTTPGTSESDIRDVTYQFDELNRLTDETSAGVTTHYVYDKADNPITVYYGYQSTSNYLRKVVKDYDEVNRITSITENTSSATSIKRKIFYYYDLNANLTNIHRIDPKGTTSTSNDYHVYEYRAYDAANRLSQIRTHNNSWSGPVIQDHRSFYDAKGNLRQVIEDHPSSSLSDRIITNIYDNVDRLTQEVIERNPSSTTTTGYAYDKRSNRTSKTINGSSTSYIYNGLNQLQSAGGTTYTYDLNGNRQTRKASGVTDHYVYGFDNTLLRLDKNTSGGTNEYYFTYDSRTRRIGKDIGSTQTTVAFSGGNSTQEYTGPNASGALKVEYLRGTGTSGGGIGSMLYSVRNGTYSYASNNGRGDVTARTNTSGTVTFQAGYEAFGTRQAGDEIGSDTDPHRASTKEEDASGLQNGGRRYRDLETGVWLTRDPAGHVDGPNVYAYVVQNPWSKVDPYGLYWGEGWLGNPIEAGVEILGDVGQVFTTNPVTTAKNAASHVKQNYQKHGFIQGTLETVGINGVKSAMQGHDQITGKELEGKERWKSAFGVLAAFKASKFVKKKGDTPDVKDKNEKAKGDADESPTESAPEAPDSGDNLFRVVDDVELADIQKTGEFKTTPGSFEGKQFVDNLGDAQALQKGFSEFFGGNQTVVPGKAPQSVIDNASKVPFADIPNGTAITIPVKDLPKVVPNP